MTAQFKTLGGLAFLLLVTACIAPTEQTERVNATEEEIVAAVPVSLACSIPPTGTPKLPLPPDFVLENIPETVDDAFTEFEEYMNQVAEAEAAWETWARKTDSFDLWLCVKAGLKGYRARASEIFNFWLTQFPPTGG